MNTSDEYQPVTVWDRLQIWADYFSDWANAILVKETRQALKSKQFVITFLLMLIAAWVISAFGVLIGGQSIQYNNTATGFFLFYYVVLTFTILVIVPFIAFRSLLQERDLFTFDLLSITTLSPAKIVIGKLLSALMQTLIYYSALAPFIAFTSFLNGFDFALTSFFLVLAILLSIFFCTIGLMLGALVKSRIYQALMTVAVLIGLVIQYFVFFSMLMSGAFIEGAIMFDQPEFWWSMGLMLLGMISYIVLFIQIATSQLTFESGNRSSSVRITCFVQFLLFWVSIFATVSYFSTGSSYFMRDEEVMALVSISAIHLAIIGLFASAETNYISRRVRNKLPSRKLYRFLATPFLPGGSRGYLYCLIQIFMLWFFAMGFWFICGNNGSSRQTMQLFNFVTLCCSYLIIFLGICTAITRLGQKLTADIYPVHARVFTFILLAGCSLFPLIYRIAGIVTYNQFVLLDGMGVFHTLAVATESRHQDSILILVVIIAMLAGLTILFNMSSLLKSILEILKYQRTNPIDQKPKSTKNMQESLQPEA